jgi:A/G-specific adenine glycosylase
MPTPAIDPTDPLIGPLLAWYGAHRRVLPWRDVADPYAVWISEVMLQQTQVATVTPYFLRWMVRLPDVAVLAAAELQDVLALWRGLGYYARARNLHRAARHIVAACGGELPRTRDGLAAIPGIGPYTAGAIASIAFGEPVPAVDGNARRVLARLLAVEGDPRRGASARAIAAHAARLVPCGAPGAWNQALMELGARVCVPRAPRCDVCPVADPCRARQTGRQREIPARSPRPAPREAHVFACVLRHPDGAVLVARRPERGLLGGLWTFPTLPVPPSPTCFGADTLPAPDDADTASALIAATFGLAIAGVRVLPAVQHVFTHIRLTATPVVAEVRGGRTDPADADGVYAEWRWVSWEDLTDLATSVLMDKLVTATRPG